MLTTVENVLVKFLFIKQSFQVLFLWLIVLLLSGLKEWNSIGIPTTFLNNKRNVLNMVFVKWAWAWTLICLSPYCIITAYVYGCEKWKKFIAISGIRLLIATFLWYFWTKIVFIYLENLTGVCLNEYKDPIFSIEDKKSCLKLGKGHQFIAFDISGHAFILTFAILLITSEIQIHKNWNKITNNAAQFIPIGSKTLANLKSNVQKSYFIIMLSFIFCFLLLFIWFLMLVSTCLYFHTVLSKAIGTASAILSWMLCYVDIYPRFDLSPGDGPLKKLLTSKYQNKCL